MPRFRKRRREAGEFSLQITALADVLIVVLIFLLKTFSSGLVESETITASKEIRLPSVASGGMAQKGIKVEVFRDRVEVSGQVSATLEASRFREQDLNDDLTDGNGSSKALNRAFAQAKQGYRSEVPNDPNSATVWIMADRGVPYATIQTVIASAAVAGLTDFKLAVEKED